MSRLAAPLVTLLIAGCALRLGGPGPESLRVVLATVPSATPAASVGDWLRALEADVALIASATTNDSAWFALLAQRSSLQPSAPAVPTGLVALAAWPLLGDTAISLEPTVTPITIQDALFETGEGKTLDLMVASVPAGASARDVTRSLMTYVATDVLNDAIVLLALRAHDRATADSIGMLIEPAFAGVARCEDQHELLAAVQPGALRLYYSPALRVRCDAVRGFDSPFPALLARVVLDD